MESNTDKMRAEFEKWGLPYLRNQYSYYNEDTCKQLLTCSQGEALWAAWQAALNLNPPAGHEVGEDVAVIPLGRTRMKHDFGAYTGYTHDIVKVGDNIIVTVGYEYPEGPQYQPSHKMKFLLPCSESIAAMPNKEAALREGWLKIKEKPPMRERNYLVLSITHGLQVGYWSDKGFAGTNWCFDVPNVESYHEIPPLSGEQKTVTEEGK